MFNETRPSRASRRDATAQGVLEAAREAFERVGFEGANLRAIAARAGVSAGTVLHHYGDKRELLNAALFDDLEATLRRALASPGAAPLQAQLGRLSRAVFRYYQRRPALSRALLKESLFAEGDWAREFAAQVARTHAQVATLTKDAIDRGELRKDADPRLFAAAWFSFFQFALIAWVQGAHPRPAVLVERLVEQHLSGLRPPAPKRSRA